MRYIKTFGQVNENQFNKNRGYIATLAKDVDMDKIVKDFEIKGCEIKQTFPFGIITFNFDGNIDILKTDDILSIEVDKIVKTN